MKVRTRSFDTRKKVSLRSFNTLRLEAIAPVVFVVHNIEDLCMLMKKAHSRDYFYLLGAGSNILIESGILNKPVLILGSEFSYIKRLDSVRLEIGAATAFSKVISYAMGENLGGLEELAGIPASIGGMLASNASSFGRDILSGVEEVTVITENGEIKNFNKEDIYFSYRHSSLKDYIIIKAVIKLSKSDNVKNNVSSYLRKRMSSQDFFYPSAGCIFKNPPAVSAGCLIDKCGLKGFRVGGAQVSLKHGNFIVNRDNAKVQDVNYIISVIKERINDRFGVSLEEEIVRWK